MFRTLYAALETVFPPEDTTDDSPETRQRNKQNEMLLEANKSVIILTCWLLLTFPAAWARGLSLSITAGFAGLAISQTQNLFKLGDHLTVAFCSIMLPFIIGLVFAGTASEDLDTRGATAVSVLSAVLLLFFIFRLFISSEVMEEINTKQRSYSDEDTQGFCGVCILQAIASLILTIAGSCVGIEKGKLPLLGCGFGTALMSTQNLKTLDDMTNGGPIIELLSLFLGLTVDTFPLAIELSLDEGEDNPRVMLFAAWMSCGVSFAFSAVIGISMVNSEENATKKRESCGADSNERALDEVHGDVVSTVQTPEDAMEV